MPKGLQTFSQLRFLWHCRRNRLAHALSTLRGEGRVVPERVLWAMYRLGMHASVSAASSSASGWKSHFARAVSHAACGRMTQARDALAAFLRMPGASRKIDELAMALAPFLPGQALELIEGQDGVSPALLAALLLRNGHMLRASQLLDSLPATATETWPELHLLHTNAHPGAPAAQLARLNALLSAYGVPPVHLVDASRPPSPVNLAGGALPQLAARGPLVTVLMTTFRTGIRASAAIASVLAQTHQNLELIVVDDASGDDTPLLARAWADRDPRVRCVVLPRNVGTYAAKRIGLEYASGEFVTCHDSDDWSHPEKIARQLAPLLSNRSIAGTVSNLVRMQDDGVFHARAVYPLMRLNPSSLLFRRKQVLEAAGVWDCVRTGADSELLARLRVVFGPKAIMKIAQPLSLGSHRPNSLMTATDTGHSEHAMSPQRLAYWEAWSRWHIDVLAGGQTPYLATDLRSSASNRPFPAPEPLRVSPEDVDFCLSHLGF